MKAVGSMASEIIVVAGWEIFMISGAMLLPDKSEYEQSCHTLQFNAQLMLLSQLMLATYSPHSHYCLQPRFPFSNPHFITFPFFRKVGRVQEEKRESSAKRLTNSWKGKGGHTVNLWYFYVYSDCSLDLEHSLLSIVCFAFPQIWLWWSPSYVLIYIFCHL